jgi:hypothetical protein
MQALKVQAENVPSALQRQLLQPSSAKKVEFGSQTFLISGFSIQNLKVQAALVPSALQWHVLQPSGAWYDVFGSHIFLVSLLFLWQSLNVQAA